MFCNDLREKYEEKIILKGVDAETMNILLDYTYTSKMLITKENVQKVLEAASLFQVQITRMQGSSHVALAAPCLTLVSSLQTSLISWVLEAFCFMFTYTVVKNGSGSHVLLQRANSWALPPRAAPTCLPSGSGLRGWDSAPQDSDQPVTLQPERAGGQWLA